MNPSQDDNREEIRRRAYELWERDGRAGNPEDHWFQAERELAERTQETGEATVESVRPVEAVRSAAEIDAGDARPDVEDAAKPLRKGRSRRGT